MKDKDRVLVSKNKKKIYQSEDSIYSNLNLINYLKYFTGFDLKC